MTWSGAGEPLSSEPESPVNRTGCWISGEDMGGSHLT